VGILAIPRSVNLISSAAFSYLELRESAKSDGSASICVGRWLGSQGAFVFRAGGCPDRGVSVSDYTGHRNPSSLNISGGSGRIETMPGSG
jgi:hypothetical protein